MIIKLIIIDDRLTDRGIADSVVDHSIHWHRHRVLGQHLFIYFVMFCENISSKLLLTSWGGTPKVIVRRSTFWYVSMHGITKKIPGKRKHILN